MVEPEKLLLVLVVSLVDCPRYHLVGVGVLLLRLLLDCPGRYKRPSSGLQHPRDLSEALRAALVGRKMVYDGYADHVVERRVTNRQVDRARAEYGLAAFRGDLAKRHRNVGANVDGGRVDAEVSPVPAAEVEKKRVLRK